MKQMISKCIGRLERVNGDSPDITLNIRLSSYPTHVVKSKNLKVKVARIKQVQNVVVENRYAMLRGTNSCLKNARGAQILLLMYQAHEYPRCFEDAGYPLNMDRSERATR